MHFILLFIYFALFPFFLVSFCWYGNKFCLLFGASPFFFLLAFLLPCMAFSFVDGVIYCFVVFVVFWLICVRFAVHYSLTCGFVAFCVGECSFDIEKLMIGEGGYFRPKTIWCKFLFLKNFFEKRKI